MSTPLAEFQRLFKQATRHPFCSNGAAPGPAELGAYGCFEVYSNAYRARMTQALADDFPRVVEKAGRKEFDLLVGRYLSANPSRYWTISEVGKGLLEFLEGELADLAREDWLENLAFLSPEPSEEIRVTAEDLRSGLTPEMVVRTHPSVHLASLQNGETSIAWRKDGGTFLDTVSGKETQVLQELQTGKTIVELLQRLEELNWGEAETRKLFSVWTAEGIVIIERERK